MTMKNLQVTKTKSHVHCKFVQFRGSLSESCMSYSRRIP